MSAGAGSASSVRRALHYSSDDEETPSDELHMPNGPEHEQYADHIDEHIDEHSDEVASSDDASMEDEQDDEDHVEM